MPQDLETIVAGQVDRAHAFTPYFPTFVMYYSNVVDRDVPPPDKDEDETEFRKRVESTAFKHPAKNIFDLVAQLAFDLVKAGVNELHPMFMCENISQLSTVTQRDTQHLDGRVAELHLMLHKYVLESWPDEMRIRAGLHLCRELLTNFAVIEGRPIVDRFVKLVEAKNGAGVVE